MRVALLSLAALAFSAGLAHADGPKIGVIVVGDDAPRVAAYLEHWLQRHDHPVVAQAMSADAITTVTNCLLVDDPKCARSVVEQRAKADAVLFARAELSKDKSFVLNAYWFAKGHEAIAERRACEHCSEDEWHGVADQVLDALTAQLVKTGHLHVESEPTGLIVFFDNAQVGLTPLDRDVPAGHHRVDLLRDGHHVGRRNVEIDANDTTEVHIKAKLESTGGGGGGSYTVPGIVLGGGIVALGAGSILLYYGSLGGSSQKFVYPDSTPIGIGAIAAGLGATIIGSVLFVQAGQTKSTPVVSMTHDSAYVGWSTRF